MWSCWFDPHTPSTLNRFHADLQKWFVDQAPTLLCVVDLRRESGNVEWPPGVPTAVGVEGGVALFHTPHAHANSSERPGCVWTWQWCGFTDLLAQVTAEAVRSFLEEDADDSVSDAAASEVSGSPMSTVSSKRLHLNIPSATFVGGQTIARLLCLWSISAQECERAWAGIKELAGSSGGSGHTSRNSFSAYAQALSLARGRLQCWSSLAALARIAGRWNKLSPESIVTSKLCDWSELCYLMWMGVDPTDLLPEAMWAEYAEEVRLCVQHQALSISRVFCRSVQRFCDSSYKSSSQQLFVHRQTRSR